MALAPRLSTVSGLCMTTPPHLYRSTAIFTDPSPFATVCGMTAPLSMALNVLCLHPQLRMLEQNLPGIQTGRYARPVSVVAYADDVTIFLTSVSEFPIIEDSIHQ
jgi:hypothetical protein